MRGSGGRDGIGWTGLLFFSEEGLSVLRRSVFALSLALALSACGGGDDNPNGPTPPPPQGPANLVVEDLTVGTGTEALAGKLIDTNYALYTYDPAGSGGRGVLLQSSTLPTFRQGTNAVIAGYDQGIIGMRVGGIRRLTIPPSLGYGAQGVPQIGIQPNAWIVFDIQLTNVRD
jgi:FKBP-type peptidyl-prolyl cis-trans isomerase FkpA